MFAPEFFKDYGAYSVVALCLFYLFTRLSKLEKRIEEVEQRSGRLAILLERVCAGYTDVRNELLKVARILRKGGQISETHLDEIEATPDIDALLKGPTQ